MCFTSARPFRSNVSTRTGFLLTVCNARGATNCVAFGVITTSTRAPRFTSARTISGALYAAIPPDTPSSTRLPLSDATREVYVRKVPGTFLTSAEDQLLAVGDDLVEVALVVRLGVEAHHGLGAAHAHE